MIDMTRAQLDTAREMQEQRPDSEFYEAMPELDYRRLWRSFRKGEACHIAEAVSDAAMDAVAKLECVDHLPAVLAALGERVGKAFVEKFQEHAGREMREKFAASGELLECVRVGVVGVEE